MSKPTDAPFALTSEGRVILNMTHTDGDQELASLLERAAALRGRVFIGVELSKSETKYILERLGDAAAETAGYIAGGRASRK